MIQASFRPIEHRIQSPKGGLIRAPFSAKWSSTLDSLERELGHLKARDIIIEVDCELSDIRNDGWPRSSARIQTPGIRLSFVSRHGPLSYTCATYTHWEANVRAVALTLERLRAVERYGCVKAGEQYKGWAQLPPGGSGSSGGIVAGEWATAEDAARFLLTVWGGDFTPDDVEAVVMDPTGTWRDAAKKVHPDITRDNGAAMTKVNRAKDFIEKAMVAA